MRCAQSKSLSRVSLVGLSLVPVAMIFMAMISIFAIAAAGQTENTLYTFTGGADGSWPKAGVVFGPHGDLYGTTQYGGVNTFGTVYKVSSTGGAWTETVLYNFTDVNDGAGPMGSLAFDAAGNIYGTTAYGNLNGTIFELTPNVDGTWSATQLYSFTGGSDGSEPLTGVTFDKAGNLYGTTFTGGKGYGVLYELSPNGNGTWSETVIHAFGAFSGDALLPSTGVLIDADGNLYGAALAGGATENGAVYRFSPNSDGSWRELLYSFTGKDNVGFPEVLAFEEGGSLVGGTSGGGKENAICGLSGCGTIFRLAPASGGSWTFTVVYWFDGTTGKSPSGLVVDDTGNLYGTTLDGGTNFGVAFELNRGSGGQPWSYSVLYDFGASGGGIEPRGLILKNRHLFGTDLSTTTCYLCGTVWEITP